MTNPILIFKNVISFISIFIFCINVLSAQMQKKNTSGNLISDPLQKVSPAELPSGGQLKTGISEEQINGFLDENGNPLFQKKDYMSDDSLQSDAIQQYLFTGSSEGDYYGFSVASAGDVNADGYDDIIIGAYLYDVDGFNYGRAYIYFGGAELNTTADVSLAGTVINGQFGRFAASAGDVNRDGYCDVIVGEGNGLYSYIFLGGANMNSVSDLTLVSSSPVSTISVSGAGDVNGDGYSDVMCGNLDYNSGMGRVCIYFGGAVMNSGSDVCITGENINNNLGVKLAPAGDVNGDGYSDVIIGAQGYNTYTGRAYIFYGGTNMDNNADVFLTGENIFNTFGFSVSSAGDVNKDGFSDVIVGAYGYNSYLGRAYIYYGGMLMNNTADVIFTGYEPSSLLGGSVSSAGDINGDGYSDVMVGANGLNSYKGRVYVYYGGASMNTVADNIFTGKAAGDNFGYLVANAGDVNHDGYSDMIVGAYTNDDAGADAGSAYLYTNTFSNASIPINTFTGEADNDGFGYLVSDAGDVNGDGYADVLSSAFNNNKAYIFLGGDNMDNIPDIIFNEAAGEGYGRSFSSAGDVNGDGYSDVIVGAPFYNSNQGKAYIYYGGTNMNNTADLIMTGENTGDEFGTCVSSAGKMNGDIYSDVIIGAIVYNSNAGRAYIYFGGAVMNNVADVILNGEFTGNQFGGVISPAGDVNGDGYSDVILGSPNYNGVTGRAYIFFGGASISTTPGVIFDGLPPVDRFGWSVSSAGDVNGDGYSDVIVGALNFSNVFRGSAYIFYGGAGMNNVADVTLKGNDLDYWFGYTVSDAGDMNIDGFTDVIVSSYINNKVYIYLGGTVMDNISDHIIEGPFGNPYEFLGNSVSGAGDVDGDGYADIIVGCDYNNIYIGKTNAYIFRYPQVGTDIPDENFTGAAPGDRLGYSVSSAGDVNADGFTDVIAGAPNNDAGGSDAGRAYIYFGGQPMDYIADVVLTGAAAGDNFGVSVSSAGDLNADGYSDVVVGANLNDAGGLNAGRVYVYYGGASMNNVADVIMTGATAGDEFGFSVSSGNFNGYIISDIWSDIIVGAYKYDEGAFTDAGRAYVYFGAPVMDNNADVVMVGIAAGDGLGICVSSAGDVNTDGYTDIVVGACFNDAGGTDAGRAYIYYGGFGISSVPSLSLTGSTAGEQLGVSVASAGDVNGDGYIDVITGSPSNTAAGFNAGRAYIYFGGALMNNSPDITLTGIAAQNYFGNSVSSAGDLNQDGYSDIIIGAAYGTITDHLKGKAYVYYGGAFMDNNADIILTGENTNDLFGGCVANAGDVNGDGQTDVLAGAFLNDAGGTDAGKAYVFTSSSPLEQCVLTLQALPEGFYDPATKTLNSSDTITVKLHSSVFPFNLIDQAKGVINKNTFYGKFFFRSAPTGNYYLDIRHRNCVETWSSSPVMLVRNTNNVYDLSSSVSKSYGSNIQQVDASPLRFGIFSGDVDQNGTVNLTDVLTVFNQSIIFATGYKVTDLTGNYITDLNDVIFAFNNSIGFVVKVTP